LDAVEHLGQSGKRVAVGRHIAFDRRRLHDELRAFFHRVDELAFLGRILDPAGGSFVVRPRGPYTATRRYLPGTAVLETTYETLTGSARVLDCQPIVEGARRLHPLREILRIVEGVSGTIAFGVQVEPRPAYARPELKPRLTDRLGFGWTWGDEALHVRADFPIVATEAVASGAFEVSQGERRRIVLGYVKGEPMVFGQLGDDADARLEETAIWWRGWSDQVRYDGAHRSIVVRSAVTLKLLSFCLSGAIVAAPTHPCPRRSAVCATGITVTVGCVTRD